MVFSQRQVAYVYDVDVKPNNKHIIHPPTRVVHIRINTGGESLEQFNQRDDNMSGR